MPCHFYGSVFCGVAIGCKLTSVQITDLGLDADLLNRYWANLHKRHWTRDVNDLFKAAHRLAISSPPSYFTLAILAFRRDHIRWHDVMAARNKLWTIRKDFINNAKLLHCSVCSQHIQVRDRHTQVRILAAILHHAPLINPSDSDKVGGLICASHQASKIDVGL